jgi:hypothetical protein
VIEACIAVLGSTAGQDVEPTLRVLGKMLSARVFEAMSVDELCPLVEEARALALA